MKWRCILGLLSIDYKNVCREWDRSLSLLCCMFALKFELKSVEENRRGGAYG